MGIREDDGLITRNTSRFLPHLLRKASWLKPPAMSSTRSDAPTGEGNPLWDRWLDK